MILKRVRALSYNSTKHMCTGCVYLRDNECRHPEHLKGPGSTNQCTEWSGAWRRNFIFIRDTLKGRAAYTALVLEHGTEQDGDSH